MRASFLRAGLVAAAVVVLVAAVPALRTTASWHGPAAVRISPIANSKPDTQGPKNFDLSGEAAGLTPGVRRPLGVRIRNDNHFDVDVTRIDVRVLDGTGACPGSNVEAQPFTGRFTVPAQTTATKELGIRLKPDAPDVCKGVQFPLTYSGTAVKK